MNICIIIDDYLPASIKIGAKMMHDLAVEFVSLGHCVSVITPAPGLEKKFEVSVLEGVTVCRFRSGTIKNVSKITRAVNETLLSFRAWSSLHSYLRLHPQDIIIYYSPSIFWGILVFKLKTLWRAKSYLVLRDFFPQWVIDNGMLSRYSPITLYFRFFEWINYKAADKIGIQSPKNMQWFSQQVCSDSNLELLYNWAADDAVVSKNDFYRQKLGLMDKVVFFYGGNIGVAQDMMNIVRLAKSLAMEQTAHFVLVGAGDEVELVSTAILNANLKNITLLPSVSQQEYKHMLSEFDIGLFTLHPGHTTHNFPGKLLGYMAQSKPILGSVNVGNDLKDIVENSGAGLVSINGCDEDFLSNALRLLNDSEFRMRTGNNAKQLLATHFSVHSAANKILLSII